MLRSCLNPNDWRKISILSLSLAALGGLILRIQYSGYLSLENIDLRRSHSHLGFYGFLFPLLWYELKNKFWVPRNHFKKIYVILLALSAFGFATAGYGILAHISSFLTLVIWLIFAFKNIGVVKNINQSIINIIPLSIILSAFVILFVLVSRFAMSEGVLLLVRVFLVMLLFGVFAPLTLQKVSDRDPNGILWIMSVVGFGLFLAESTGYLLVMPALLGGLICYSIVPNIKSSLDAKNRVRFYWLGIALILFFLSLQIVPNNHFTAVSGIHFFVFLIVVPTFLYFKNKIFRFMYEVSALLMVVLIYSQNVITWNYHENQIALSAFSAIVALCIFCGLKSSATDS